MAKKAKKKKAEAEANVPQVQETTTIEPTEVQETTTTNETQPEQPKKRLSGSDFVMRHLIQNPDATVDQIKEELNKTGYKLAESTIESWPPFMQKVFKFQEELGWKRPNEKADPATTEPASQGNGSNA